MKRFIRTIPGKLTLFLVTLLCAAVLTGCIAGVAVMAEEGFYGSTREEIRREYLARAAWGDLIETLQEIAQADWKGETPPHRSLQEKGLYYGVYNRDGELIQSSTGFDEKTDCPYCYSCLLGDADWSFIPGDEDSFWNQMSLSERKQVVAGQAGVYTIRAYPDENAGILTQDSTYQWIDRAYTVRYGIIALGVVMGIGCVACFVGLMCVSGRRPDTDKLLPGPLHRVPIDLMVGVSIAVSIGAILSVGQCFFFDDFFVAGLMLVTALAVAALALGLCMSIACRIKAGGVVRGLLRNTVIWRCCKLAWRGLKALGRWCRRFGGFLVRGCRKLPMIWRTCLIFLLLCVLELLVIGVSWYEPGIYLFFWFVEHILLAGVILFGALTLRKLQRGGEALARGDLSYQVDTHRMYWDFKRHGENLNNIAGGMTQAVEQRMKSERMKTELITNVSHDIKTPLTSIINYADLITKEKSDNPKIGEYAQVLGRQSDRLKRLIEDLVEASKASTGNLEVLLAPCDAENFLVQISGEYEKKLADAGLELVTQVPEQSLRVMADGRRMLRIFDNLMNNICKYAQRGTRVYLALEERDLMAVITFRNISRAPLNLSAEELMERFVRGDASRSGEGNGLGLSIARSLTELQNGTFDLDVDGDLFKVTLRFPLLPEE